MQRAKAVAFLALIAVAHVGLDVTHAAEPSAMPRVTVDGCRFVDYAGRQLILHGVNTGGNDKTTPRTWLGPDSYARVKAWGLNVVRLQIEWSELEPECGKHSEDYLKQVDGQIAMAKSNGIYVYLDMHQDLWGVKAGDGAPAWATLDEGQKHIENPEYWQESYWISPMVHKAFDNFYANKPGPDGVGIQDRFAMAWRHVAQRYARENAVIGYDLLNEPYPGSPMKMLPLLVAAKMVQSLAAKGELHEVSELLKSWGDAEKRRRLLKKLDDPAMLRDFLNAMEPLLQAYERDSLSPMYRRVAKAIREVDKDHLLLLEPGGGAIIGVKSHIRPVVDDAGVRDRFQAIVPHAYGLPDGGAAAIHMAIIMESISDLSQRLAMPVLVGEWDADVGKNREVERRDMAMTIVDELEKRRFGDTFWLLKPDVDKKLFFPAVCRPYPSAVAGETVEYKWDRKAGAFTCDWLEKGTVRQPSRVYVPQLAFPRGFAVELMPASPYRLEEVGGKGGGVFVVIEPLGRPGKRSLSIHAAGR